MTGDPLTAKVELPLVVSVSTSGDAVKFVMLTDCESRAPACALKATLLPGVIWNEVAASAGFTANIVKAVSAVKIIRYGLK